MALVELENGDLVDPSVLNGNFEYLDDKIGTTAETIESNIDSLTSQVTTIGTTVGNGGVVPAGAVFNFAGGTVPVGYLLCDGSAVSRSTYASLFSVIGVTYGSGDGSTTFNLPLLTDGRFAQGGTTAGTQVAAGLPTMTTGADGAHAHYVDGMPDFGVMPRGDDRGGCVSYSRTGATRVDGAHSHTFSWGASTDTVQPKALILLPCIKY